LQKLPLYISERTTVRHYVRSVGTLPNKVNNNGTVLQGAFKRESPQKTDKTDKKLNHLSFQLTEQLKIVCQQIWRNVLPLFFPRYTGVKKRPNTINFLFQILLFYFEELKKQQQQHNRTYFYFCFPILTVLAKISSLLDFVI
jgi:hypothetical protein